jgi:hypothetical protein
VKAARFVPIVAIAALIIGATVLDRHQDAVPSVSFGSITTPPMPVVPQGAPLSSSWFCPGVPAGAPAQGTGTISVLNAGDAPIDGSMTVYPSAGQPVTVPLTVKERSRTDIQPSKVAPSQWAGAVVELLGAEGVVEQSVVGPTGRSATACSNAASSTWYLADGATTVDANMALLLLNPFPDDAIVDIDFATTEGSRQPQETQGFVVRGQSLRVVPLNDIVRREPTVAVSVQARSGRVVTGRVQSYVSGAKRALSVSLGSPQPQVEWWFATGDKGNNVSEHLAIYNPGENDTDVDVAFYPTDPAQAQNVQPVTVTAPAGTSVLVDVPSTDGVPAGQHSIQVRSQGDPVVVERTLELQGDAARNVTIQPGSPLTATQWTFVTGAGDGSETLVVANTTGQDGTVTVKALGPAGPTPLPGLNGVTLASAGTLRVDLDQKGAAGLPVFVESSVDVVAERITGAPAGKPGVGIARGIPTLSPAATQATGTD